MNKTQLVDALAARIGDRRTAATAVDGLLETIVDTVRSGETVSLTGFGVFESRARAARTARNPRTGDTVNVPATTVPAFRPGAGFRTAVGGGGAPAPRAAASRRAINGAPVEQPSAKPEPTARKSGKAASKTAKAKSNGSFAADAPATKPAEKKSGKADKPAKAEKPAKGKKGNGKKGNGKK
jgi:DNA-binding protein HU-beta